VAQGTLIHNPIRGGSRPGPRVVRAGKTRGSTSCFETVETDTGPHLAGRDPVLGFCRRAPFPRLASLCGEECQPRNYLHTKQLMYHDEGAPWRDLDDLLARPP